MNKKEELRIFTEMFDALLDTVDEQLECLTELGYDDHPVGISIMWMMPQGEKLLERAKQGETKLLDEEHTSGLLVSLELVSELAEAVLEENEEANQPADQPSMVTHRIQ